MSTKRVTTSLGDFVAHPSGVWDLTAPKATLFGRRLKVVSMLEDPPTLDRVAALEQFFRDQQNFKAAVADLLRFGPLAGVDDPEVLFQRCHELQVSLAENDYDDDEVEKHVDIYITVYTSPDEAPIDITVRDYAKVSW